MARDWKKKNKNSSNFCYREKKKCGKQEARKCWGLPVWVNRPTCQHLKLSFVCRVTDRGYWDLCGRKAACPGTTDMVFSKSWAENIDMETKHITPFFSFQNYSPSFTQPHRSTLSWKIFFSNNFQKIPAEHEEEPLYSPLEQAALYWNPEHQNSPNLDKTSSTHLDQNIQDKVVPAACTKYRNTLME